jgi:hypothetical protein
MKDQRKIQNSINKAKYKVQYNVHTKNDKRSGKKVIMKHYGTFMFVFTKYTKHQF